MSYATLNGVEMYYERKGEGFPLVMLHGFPIDSRMWDRQFDEFAQHFQVIRFDFAGFGRSSAHEEDYSILDDIKELLSSLDIEKAHFLGFSIGGNIAMDFAITHPEMVEKLIVASTGFLGWKTFSKERQTFNEEINACYQNGNKEKMIELMCKTWILGPFRKEHEVDPEILTTYYEILKTNVYRERGKGQMKLPERLEIEKIDAPTLIITTKYDFSEFSEIADFLQQNIVNSTRLCLPAAHMVNMEKPKEFNTTILQYLEIS